MPDLGSRAGVGDPPPRSRRLDPLGGLLRSGGSRVPFVRLALKGILSIAPHPSHHHRIPATPFYSKRGGDPNLPLQEGRSGA